MISHRAVEAALVARAQSGEFICRGGGIELEVSRSLYSPIPPAIRRLMTKALSRVVRDTKRRGCKSGAMTHAEERVLRWMLHEGLWGPSGRCDPSLARIARMVGVARNTVLRAIQIGERIGLFRKYRRWRLVNVVLDDGTVARRRRQASNLYVFNLSFGQMKGETEGERQSRWMEWTAHLSGLRSPVQMLLFGMTAAKKVSSGFKCGTGSSREYNKEPDPVKSGDMLADKLAKFAAVFEARSKQTA